MSTHALDAEAEEMPLTDDQLRRIAFLLGLSDRGGQDEKEEA